MTITEFGHEADKAALSLEDIKRLIEMSTRYLLSSDDREARIWMFRPDEPSPFLQSSIQIGDDKFSIYLADPFAGMQPILLNHTTISTNDPVQIPFRPTAILDSNLVTYLHHYVTGGKLLDSNQRDTVRGFLEFVIEKRMDYNPFFYYVEGAAKNQESVMLKYSENVSRSILLLHTMNTDRFLNTGEIVADPKIFAMYLEEYEGQSVNEIAPRYARAMVQRTDPRLKNLATLIYAALLKIGIIQKASKLPLVGKCRELRVFMQDVLRIGMGTERMLALAYFTGKFDSFIPIQRGAVFERVLRRLKAAAWDLILLRLPPQLLAISPDDEITVGYVCTSDRSLWQLARTGRLQAVTRMAGAVEGTPVWSYDPAPLELNVDATTMRQIFDEDTDWQRNRVPYVAGDAPQTSREDLTVIVRDLERQVAAICGN